MIGKASEIKTLITGGFYDELDGRIQESLKKIGNADVLDIKFSAKQGFYAALIIYKEAKEDD